MVAGAAGRAAVLLREEGEIADFPGAELLPRPPAAKVGLGVFLAVAGCLFSLLSAAFFMRMDAPDWQAPPIARDFVVQHGGLDREQPRAGGATRRRSARNRCLKSWLLVGGGCALLFLLGQLWAWRELAAQGLYASSNPANAFFYLLTGAHALHLVGGLAALARTARAAWSGRDGAPNWRRAWNFAPSIGIFCCSSGFCCSRCSRAGPIISASFAVGCFPKERG